MEDDKTSLTKAEKEKIKDAHPTETYTEEKWARLQGMTRAFKILCQVNLNLQHVI